jgi:predicted lipoprotein with Yx(FWY)xxD motif
MRRAAVFAALVITFQRGVRMKPRNLTLLLAGLLMSIGVAAQDFKKMNGMMVNGAGMTLYTFDKDSGGKSTCNGPCAANWPPVMAAADAKPSGDWTIITRDDGAKQWAYKGKPVYVWSKDTKPGDMTGDNFNNAWHVVKE